MGMILKHENFFMQPRGLQFMSLVQPKVLLLLIFAWGLMEHGN
jgi:hypothetical protein